MVEMVGKIQIFGVIKYDPDIIFRAHGFLSSCDTETDLLAMDILDLG